MSSGGKGHAPLVTDPAVPSPVCPQRQAARDPAPRVEGHGFLLGVCLVGDGEGAVPPRPAAQTPDSGFPDRQDCSIHCAREAFDPSLFPDSPGHLLMARKCLSWVMTATALNKGKMSHISRCWPQLARSGVGVAPAPCARLPVLPCLTRTGGACLLLQVTHGRGLSCWRPRL